MEPLELQVLADELVQQEGLAGGGGARLARVVQRGEDLSPDAGAHLPQRPAATQRLLQGCAETEARRRRSTGLPRRIPPPAPSPPGTRAAPAAVTRFQLGDRRHLGRGWGRKPTRAGSPPFDPLARAHPIAARADSAATGVGGGC